MSHKQSPWKKYKFFFCVVMWSVAIIASASWLMFYLVGTLSDSFPDNGTQASEMDVFDSMVELTEKKVDRYLGEWEFSEPKIPGHFHHVGKWYEPDKWNFCIECHGPTPHSRTPKERAFLNMHSMFISCNVCHVREQDDVAPTRFGWMALSDGKLCPNPEMPEGVWGEYGTKVIPLSADDPSKPVALEDVKVFADKFRENMNQLSDRQRVVANKVIHRRCVEKPVACSDCHKSENAFLNYTALGYSQERAAFLMSVEVAELALKSETFYMPDLLKTDTDDQESKDTQEDSK